MSRVPDLFKQFREWLDDGRDFTTLDSDVQQVIDELIAEDEALEKGQPTMSQVSQGGKPAKRKKRRMGMYSDEEDDEEDDNLIQKANDEQMFTLGPWYIPNHNDAHDEWTDADELQKALWDYVKTGDRQIRLQHNKDIVAGEWVEAMSFPVPISLNMTKANGEAREVTYPTGTVFLGVKWLPWAWDLVKSNKITGFSIGGSAARVEMAIPVSSIPVGKAATRMVAKQATEVVAEPDAMDDLAIFKMVARRYIGGEEPIFPEPRPEATLMRINGVDCVVTPLTKSYRSGVRNVAGIAGSDGSRAVVRTDGERFWAVGSKAFEQIPFAKAQIIFAEVAKKKFGSRAEAGRYAANIRWQRRAKNVPNAQARAATGIPDGSAPEPVTEAGMALGSARGGAGSLVTHCDLDAVAADMQKAGLKEPTPEMYYKHLTPERRAVWDQAIAEKVNGVPVNPDGPNAYMMGGGGASGKSRAIEDGSVSVPNADRSKGAVQAVDVNPDSAKEQLPGYRNMVAKKNSEAANLHHEESSQIAALTAVAGLKQGSDIVVDGVADNGAAKTMGKADNFRALGAKRVELHVVTVDIDTARQRNIDRASKTGRLVDEKALIHGHKGVSQNFPEYAQSGRWDVVTVTDTNGGTARKIFSQSRGGAAEILDQGAFDAFIAKKDYAG